LAISTGHVARFSPEAEGSFRMPDGVGPASRGAVLAVCADWRRILASMSVVLALAVAIGIAAPVRYVAGSELLVLPSGIYAPQQDAAGSSPPPALLDRDTYLKNEIEILKSPAVAEATIKKVGLARLYPKAPSIWSAWRRPDTADPLMRAASRFARDFSATADKTGNVMTVTFRSKDPALAADVVNAAVAVYLARRGSLFEDAQFPVILAQVSGLRAELDAAETALATFKSNQNIFGYETQRDILLHQQGEIFRDAQQADSAAAQASRRLAALQSEIGTVPTQIIMYSDTNLQTQVDNLKTGLENLKIREAGLQVHASDKSPLLLDVRAQIAASRAALDRLRNVSSPSEIRKGRNPLMDTLELDRVHAQQDVDATSARHDADTKQLAQVGAAIRTLEAAEPELVRLQRRRDLAADSYQSINKTLADRRIFESIGPQRSANIRIIQPAEIPLDQAKLKILILAAGLLLSLFAGVATAALSEVFRRGYICPEKLERSLGVPVLTSIRDLPVLRYPTALLGEKAAG
jgi:uncharacterized protein involved in exopolysaccharide biosynthesis